MAKKPTGRAPGKTQISISLPEDLVGKIDKMADLENRNRSNFVATHFERLVIEYEAVEPTVQMRGRRKPRK